MAVLEQQASAWFYSVAVGANYLLNKLQTYDVELRPSARMLAISSQLVMLGNCILRVGASRKCPARAPYSSKIVT